MLLWLATLVSAAGLESLAQELIPANYQEAKVPPYTLPDPLALPHGGFVGSAQAWESTGRPATLALFENHVFGRTPRTQVRTEATQEGINQQALGGKAVAKQVSLRFPVLSKSLALNVLLYVPKHTQGPVPVFVNLNFDGNAAIHPDAALWLAPQAPTEQPSARHYPLELLIERGYALATAHYEDLEPDHVKGWKNGLRAHLGPPRQQANDWGALGVWAWAMSRMLDYLAQHEPATDAAKALAIGHSRLGKAALWAAAQDVRFAAAIANNSGEGGAALSRRQYGETIAHLNVRFPHWFCPQYKRYNGKPEALPIDHHQLLALMAPRLLYVASATDDLWADPYGEWLSTQAAQKVYSLYGLQGTGTSEWPAPNQPVGQHIGYHLRHGPHDLLAYDWEQFVNFTDTHLKNKSQKKN